MISGGLNGGFLDWVNDNSNMLALFVGILGLIGVLTGVGGVLLFAIIAISFLVGFLVTLATNLTLIENGCGDDAVAINTILNMVAFVATSLASTVGQAIVKGITAWIYTTMLPSVAKACRA